MPKLLITGGSGKLGRYLCAAFANAFEITTFDLERSCGEVRSLQGDVRDLEAIKQAVLGQDAIVHLAGVPSPRHAAAQEILAVNVLGTWTVLHAAWLMGVQRVVICSSDCATGLLHQQAPIIPLYLPVDEIHPLRPTDPYGLSKQLAEEAGHCFSRLGLQITILRPSLIIFPEMRNKLLAWGMDSHNPDLWWYVEPEDVAVAFRLALDLEAAPVQTYFIGAPNTFSPIPTLELIERRYGRLPEIHKPEIYVENPHASVFDITRARTLLGFDPVSDWRRWPVS